MADADAEPDALVTMCRMNLRHYEPFSAMAVSPCRRYVVVCTRHMPSLHPRRPSNVLVVFDLVTGTKIEEYLNCSIVQLTIGYLGERLALATGAELVLYRMAGATLLRGPVLRSRHCLLVPKGRRYVRFSVHPEGVRALLGHVDIISMRHDDMVTLEVDPEGTVLRKFDGPAFYIGTTLLAVTELERFGHRFVDTEGNEVTPPWPEVIIGDREWYGASPPEYQRSFVQWGPHLAEVRGKTIRVWDVAAGKHLGDVPVDEQWYGPMYIVRIRGMGVCDRGPGMVMASDDRVVFCNSDDLLYITTVNPVDEKYEIVPLTTVAGGFSGRFLAWFGGDNRLCVIKSVGGDLVLQTERPVDFAPFWLNWLGTENRKRFFTLMMCLFKISGAAAEIKEGADASAEREERSGGEGKKIDGGGSGAESNGGALRGLWTRLVVERMLWFFVIGSLGQGKDVFRERHGVPTDM